MKKIILLAIVFFALLNCDAQTKVEIKNDTLFVPLGKVKYVKIGDKVYEIDVQLKEVPEQTKSLGIWNNIITLPSSDTTGIFKFYNKSQLLLPIKIYGQ